MRKLNILIVVAHPDDEVLGFGASGAKISNAGHNVFTCILSGNVNARSNRPNVDTLKNNIKTAQEILGFKKTFLGDFENIKFNTIPHIDLVRFIERIIEEVKPDYIYTHHPSDLNNDHFHVSKACQAASRLYQRKDLNKILGLFFIEIQSSTDWSYRDGSSNFYPNTFVQIDEKFLNLKIKALQAYSGVMRPMPHPRSVEGITALATIRGTQSNCYFAEAFECIYNFLEFYDVPEED